MQAIPQPHGVLRSSFESLLNFLKVPYVCVWAGATLAKFGCYGGSWFGSWLVGIGLTVHGNVLWLRVAGVFSGPM